MLYAIEKTREYAKPAPGSALTGLSTDGPFRCDHCEYFQDSSCRHEKVMRDPELQVLKLLNGRIAVRGEWCCNEFVRMK